MQSNLIFFLSLLSHLGIYLENNFEVHLNDDLSFLIVIHFLESFSLNLKIYKDKDKDLNLKIPPIWETQTAQGVK